MDPGPANNQTSPAWMSLVLRGCGLGLAAALLYQFTYVMIGTNFRAVEDGTLYRAAQLSPAQLEKVIRQYGIRTVINLRGVCEPAPWYLNQSRVLASCQVSQEDLGCSASRLPSSFMIRELVEVLDRSPRPIMVHCHRGIDRTGMVVAIALLLWHDMPLEKALEELTIRYAHISFGKTGNMDRFFDLYREWLTTKGKEHSRPNFRDWLLNGYIPGECVADITLVSPEGPIPTFQAYEQGLATVHCQNHSVRTWQFKPGSTAGIHAQSAILDEKGQLLHSNRSGLLYATVPPGEGIDIRIPLPSLKPGKYTLRVDLIDEQHASFYQTGSKPLFAEVIVK